MNTQSDNPQGETANVSTVCLSYKIILMSSYRDFRFLATELRETRPPLAWLSLP